MPSMSSVTRRIVAGTGPPCVTAAVVVVVVGEIAFVATAAPPRTTPAVAAPAPAPMRKSRRVSVIFARLANDFCSAWDGVGPPASPIGSPPVSWLEGAPQTNSLVKRTARRSAWTSDALLRMTGTAVNQASRPNVWRSVAPENFPVAEMPYPGGQPYSVTRPAAWPRFSSAYWCRQRSCVRVLLAASALVLLAGHASTGEGRSSG